MRLTTVDSRWANTIAGNYRWEPEKSQDGPLAILVSRQDERIIVLRNGVEIGRARATFRDATKPLGSHVFVAKDGAQTGALFEHEWFGVGMVGHMGDDGAVPDPKAMGRVQISEQFKTFLAAEVRPGTTLMLTDYPVLEHTTGIDMAVLSSHSGI